MVEIVRNKTAIATVTAAIAVTARKRPSSLHRSVVSVVPAVIFLLVGVLLLSLDHTLIEHGVMMMVRVSTMTTTRSRSPLPPSAPSSDPPDPDPLPSFAGMNTTGVTLVKMQGNPHTCTNVVYTVNTYTPFQHNHTQHSPKQKNAKQDEGKEAAQAREQREAIVRSQTDSLRSIVRTAPKLQASTCLAFFVVDDPWMVTPSRTSRTSSTNEQRSSSHEAYALHPVWGRLPATAIAMTTFVHAQYFLYLDSDALLVYPDITPAAMYAQLRPTTRDDDDDDTKEEEASSEPPMPGLIVNKPFKGWLCGECERFGMGHGCFNSGVLLWYKSTRAAQIVHDWWQLRESDAHDNLVTENQEQEHEFFHGWSGTRQERYQDKMGEQNRLMYLFHVYQQTQQGQNHSIAATRNNNEHDNNNDKAHLIWPVPRKRSIEYNSSSCPNSMEADYTPCLQKDFGSEISWNPPPYENEDDDDDDDDDDDSSEQQSQPQPHPSSCYVHHYADDKHLIFQHAAKILQYTGKDEDRDTDSDDDDDGDDD